MPVTPVEQLTGFPECLDGRVKTLHPRVHAGLLADTRKPEHTSPSSPSWASPRSTCWCRTSTRSPRPSRRVPRPTECVEQIDIGGPAMVRASAKNHDSVAVVVEPARYDWVLEQVKNGGFALADRRLLAAAAFRHTATYDVAVASWMGSVLAPEPRRRARSRPGSAPPGTGRPRCATARTRTRRPRCTSPGRPGLAAAEQLHGKEMSYNNYVDADAAWRAAHDHDGPCVAIIKHANPCGIAVGADVAEAHRQGPRHRPGQRVRRA